MVITLDRHKKPLGFCTERRARILMEKGRACVHRYYPFTIIVKDRDVREMGDLPSYRIKIDPGSKTTGIAVVCEQTGEVMLCMQIEHRGLQVKEALDTRRAARRNRRARETWYRKPKWGNCLKKKTSGFSADSPRPEGWLPPSVKSMADNILSWVDKLSRWINLTECSFESVRFDTQLMNNLDICDVEYQQGTLFGCEVREYLLDRYGHTCQYCGGASGDSILEVEHIVPKANGGSDKVSNLTLACHTCNQVKGSTQLRQWQKAEKAAAEDRKGRKTRRDLAAARVKGIDRVLSGKTTGVSDRNCAWVNSSRRYVERGLFQRFAAVECASGATTKRNRTALGFPKDHHYDALCVGCIPSSGYKDCTKGYFLAAKAVGRGSRMRGHINMCGVIVVKFKDGRKRINGFQNGDIVAADIPAAHGKKKIPYKDSGHHVGRITIRRGQTACSIRSSKGKEVNPNYKYVRLLQHGDGYEYQYHK